MRSPAFSKFRRLMDLYDDVLAEEERRGRVHAAINSPNMVLFFVKDRTVYGAPEDSRIVFARMKSRDDEEGSKWKKDADFMAINLSALAAEDKVSQSVMGRKDLRRIRVIDKDEAERRLLKQPRAPGGSKVISIVPPSREEE